MPTVTPKILLFSSRLSIESNRTDSRELSNVNVSGYVNENGSKLAIQGDEDAPFTKSLPFPLEYQSLGPTVTLSGTHTPTTNVWPLLQVTDFRSCTFCFEYAPSNTGSTLNVVFYNVFRRQAVDFSDAEYFPLGFTDGTSTSTTESPNTQPYSARVVGPLVVVTRAALNNTGLTRFTVDLDGVSLPSIAGLNVLAFTAIEKVPGEGFGTLKAWFSARV